MQLARLLLCVLIFSGCFTFCMNTDLHELEVRQNKVDNQEAHPSVS